MEESLTSGGGGRGDEEGGLGKSGGKEKWVGRRKMGKLGEELGVKEIDGREEEGNFICKREERWGRAEYGNWVGGEDEGNLIWERKVSGGGIMENGARGGLEVGEIN